MTAMLSAFKGSVFLLLVFVLVGCGSSNDGANTKPAPSEEEIRVAASQLIDSTSVTFDQSKLPEGLTAEAWILVEDSTGLLISEKNAHKRMFPASLTKMMTCMLALEHGKMSDSIEITEDVFLEKDSRVRLGDAYLLGNMINEMMLQSDNDAANAIAKNIGGSISDFCKMMNEKAAYLGMEHTHFANPNGMPHDSTYTTARDLLVLARYCMRDSAFAMIVGTPFLDISLIDGRHLPCQNTNQLLTSYEGCIGVKTGYTRSAGSCLASAATRDGVTLFLILLNSKSQSLRFTESAALLDYGFRVLQK